MRILFVDGTDGYSPDRKDSKACGGILTSLTLVPRYLAKQGHEVYVRSSFKEDVVVEGVHYVSGKTLPKWDVVVLNRNLINDDLVDYSHSIGAKVVWWLHDIPQFNYCIDSAFKKVDRIVALSEYNRDTFARFYKIPPEKFVIIPNGVDKDVFKPGEYENRQPIFVMASALIKGFHPIETLLSNMKRVLPDAELRIYSSQALHGLSNSPEQEMFLATMRDNGATVRPPVPQQTLAQVMQKASICLMPNSYPENCSNLMLQAQACGLPVVTSPIGSSPEFIENGVTGVMTETMPHDLFVWWAEYVEKVLELAMNKEKHRFISEQSPRDVKSWDQIGEIWNDFVKQLG